MKKMLKIMAMLLVIGAVVFAAGCASKNSGSDTNQEAAQQVTNQGAVADNGTGNNTVAANVSADNSTDNVSVDNSTGNVSVDNSTDNVSVDNSTDNVSADNSTDNVSVDNSTTNVTVVDNATNETNNTTA
jgi:hypothetical protein